MLPSWVFLVLSANIRLDWKDIASCKHSSLFGLVVSDEGKKFYNIDPRLPSAGTFPSSFWDEFSRSLPPDVSLFP
jgi:hypothetical protein